MIALDIVCFFECKYEAFWPLKEGKCYSIGQTSS